MSTQTKWIIGIGSVLALFAIAAPIYFYRTDFTGLHRSSNPADWGPFGDYLGGVLNPIISLLTLIVTIIIAINISRIERRNHDESIHSPVKPFLTIETGDFFSSDRSLIGLSVEKDFYDYSPPQQPAGSHDYLPKRFYLKTGNKGLGIATQINVTFEIDLSDLKKLLVIDDNSVKVKVGDVKRDEDARNYIVACIKSLPQYFNYQGSFKIWEKERAGLGVVDKGEEKEVNIPSQIMSAFQLYNLIRSLKVGEYYFPPFFVTFDYRNIHGKPLSSKFKVGLLHRYDYQNVSVFKILQEEIVKQP